MVAEDQSTPMPDKDDPWTQHDEGDDEGGQPAEFVGGAANQPGSQAPPSGAAVPDDEDAADDEAG